MGNGRSLAAEADVRIVNNKLMAVEGTNRTSREIIVEDLGGLPNTVKFLKDVNILIGDGSTVIAPGTTGYSAPVPFPGAIVGYSIAEVSSPPVSGTCIIDILKAPLAEYPPVSSNSITGTNKPRLEGEMLRESTDLTSWSVSIVKNDIIGFIVEDNLNCRQLHVILSIEVGF
jgi:hypothetical protein